MALESVQLQPKVWKRYVDDTFVIWQHGSPSKQSFLEHLNNQRDSIKFTMEEEQDNRIAFLDVLVQREGLKMSSLVYRKATHTDRYLNFNSHHHPKVLAGVVKCLKNRAVCACDSNSIQPEIQHLEKTFRANSYPDSSRPDTEGETHEHTTARPAEESSPEKKILCLPYVRGVPYSRKFSQVQVFAKSPFRRNFRGFNFRV